MKLIGDPVDSSTNDTFRKPTPYMDTNLGTIDENDEDDAVPQVVVRAGCRHACSDVASIASYRMHG